MKLKSLEIKHQQYYSANPTDGKYAGKIEFFNDQGAALTVVLREDQLAGIVELCSAGIINAAKEAAQAIVATFNPVLQIESSDIPPKG
jgi:hypothetical protein